MPPSCAGAWPWQGYNTCFNVSVHTPRAQLKRPAYSYIHFIDMDSNSLFNFFLFGG